MDAIAQSSLTTAASWGLAGASLGPVGAAVGVVAGGAYGFFKGKKDKKTNDAAIAEEAQLEQQDNEARNLIVKNEEKRKQLEQWNAADSQDNSYDNDQYSDLAGTNTLPMTGAGNLSVTAPPQTLTSSDAQLKALGVIS